MDGEIDYSKDELSELLEARSGINARQYPENFANLEAAIAALQPDLDETFRDEPVDLQRSTWAVLDRPAAYRPLSIKETVLYVVVFGLGGFAIAFVFELVFALPGWQTGSIVRVIYYSLAVVPVGILFTNKHRRLPTANEFTGLVMSTYVSYAIIGVTLVWIASGFVVPIPETLGGLFSFSIPILFFIFIDFVLFFLAFRFPMRWTMQLCLRRFSSSPENSR